MFKTGDTQDILAGSFM